MKKWARDVRLMPIVLLAIVCLFVLKTMGLLFDGGYTLGQRLGSGTNLTVTTVPVAQTQQMRSPSIPLEMPQQQGAPKQPSFMQEMFGYPGGDRSAIASSSSPDITGSVAAKPAEKKKEEPPAKEPPVQVGAESIAARGTVVSMDQQRPASPGERALLERLQERRQELEARMRELELRESLVKAAEKKLETQGGPEGDKAARGPNGQSRDEPNPRIKSVVTMYETMKPKDAAKIFDRLDPKVLLEVASQIKPQRMSEIMAVMSPEAAERLTVELATQGPSERTVNPASLPKIDGKPGG